MRFLLYGTPNEQCVHEDYHQHAIDFLLGENTIEEDDVEWQLEKRLEVIVYRDSAGGVVMHCQLFHQLIRKRR